MANETRQKILATTAQLLERQGYHATGLNQILEESGTPKGSLYYYFPKGKEELAIEAIKLRMKNAVDLTRHLLSQHDDPAEAIYGMIYQFGENAKKNGCDTGAPIAAVALEASNTSETLRQACADGYDGIQAVLAAKMVMGGFSAETAVKLAAIVNASIEGAMILLRTKQDASVLFNIAEAMKVLILDAQKA